MGCYGVNAILCSFAGALMRLINRHMCWLPVLGVLSPGAAMADTALNAGDTAWMLTATALVLFMTLPGLALFYSGMVRSRNVLSVFMQCISIASLVTLLWVIYGYSLVFTESGLGWIGGLDKLFLAGVAKGSLVGSIPETVYLVFQLTFAIIAPALIVGAFAERMKFSATLWFTALWVTLVYIPVAHWVWGGGWLGDLGVLDFAGGMVVHINAGVAGLVAALVVGRRSGYPHTMMKPHNLGYTMAGAGILWVGWIGFNAGSAVAADAAAGQALLVTMVATAAAVLTWIALEWCKPGQPSALGAASGAVAGLVAITPASGFVGPMGAIAIGFLGSLCAWYAVAVIKIKLRYDDSLDAFGVHGVAGIVGAVLTGVFCAPFLGGAGFAAGVSSIAMQVVLQCVGVAVTVLYCGLVSFLILKVIDAVIGLRTSVQSEKTGLDLALHGESGYDL